MLKSFTDKLTYGMMWSLVAPMALLIFALACVGGTSSYVIVKAHYIHAKVGEFELEARVDDIKNQLKDFSNSLSQQQITLQNILKPLEKFSLMITKPETLKFTTTEKLNAYSETLQKNISQMTPNLTDAVSNLKNQSAQIDAQRKKLKVLNDELEQLKNEIKQKNNN